MSMITPAQRAMVQALIDERRSAERYPLDVSRYVATTQALVDLLAETAHERPTVRIDREGDIVIDFDRGRGDTVSLTLSEAGLGWSALVAGRSDYREAPAETIPDWVRDTLRTWATWAETGDI